MIEIIVSSFFNFFKRFARQNPPPWFFFWFVCLFVCFFCKHALRGIEFHNLFKYLLPTKNVYLTRNLEIPDSSSDAKCLLRCYILSLQLYIQL